MIRLLPTQLFVTMDEVQAYETRQAVRQARPVEDEAGAEKSQAARIIGQDPEGQEEEDQEDSELQELQTPRPASPAPQTPERRLPTRKNLVIRSSSQPAVRSLPDKSDPEDPDDDDVAAPANATGSGTADPVHAASEPLAPETPSPWRETRRERSSTASADDEPR